MIFCVEDDRNIRELVVYTLSSTGMEALAPCPWEWQAPARRAAKAKAGRAERGQKYAPWP